MNNENKSNVWIKTPEQRLAALIADEAKGAAMINDVTHTLRQLKAKSSFRIAILNQMIEDNENRKD